MKNVITIVVFIVALFFSVFEYANSFIALDENTNEKLSRMLNQYKKRADLVPNLVETVKGYATHEQKAFEEVANARSKSMQIDINTSSLSDNEEKIEKFMVAQGQLSSALGRLMTVSESYPELKANQNFLLLQSQLEDIENLISVAKRDYIEAVREYNIAIKGFPGKFVARMFNPEMKLKQDIEVGSEDAKNPQVSF
ncbi:LemA family protein [Campylobacter concisus UNSWCD]|uniref:LemA family protein n=2 Tax=Campylobacter concisus TaxID=199 RepID=UPI00025A6811|nr:LemA family protein [Campylobacter concisus]EIF06960.1 LemA family protein [Campylobacter concisus UNSWCD]